MSVILEAMRHIRPVDSKIQSSPESCTLCEVCLGVATWDCHSLHGFGVKKWTACSSHCDRFCFLYLADRQMEDNKRSIPCLVDGFKPSQRKVLFSCFKRNLKKEIKVCGESVPALK